MQHTTMIHQLYQKINPTKLFQILQLQNQMRKIKKLLQCTKTSMKHKRILITKITKKFCFMLIQMKRRLSQRKMQRKRMQITQNKMKNFQNKKFQKTNYIQFLSTQSPFVLKIAIYHCSQKKKCLKLQARISLF